MDIIKEERIKELYNALGNPALPDYTARLYMTEYLDLIGKADVTGRWVFFTQEQVNAVNDHILARERFRTLKYVLVGVFVIGVWTTILKKEVWDRESKPQTRLEYLLDPFRVESYTTKQFQEAMAEATILVSEKVAKV